MYINDAVYRKFCDICGRLCDVLDSFILFFMWYDMLFNLVFILSVTVSVFTFHIVCFCDEYVRIKEIYTKLLFDQQFQVYI